MKVKRINYPQLDAPVGPYSHAVKHENTLYTSGFTAYGTNAQFGTISAQTSAIFRQLNLVADQHDITMDHLLKVTIFVSDMGDIESLRDTLIELYDAKLPASSLIKIEALFAPELLIEIEAIFAL